MTLPDPGTDPIPEGGQPQYGFFATLFGLPILEHRIKEIFMARLDPINAALDKISTEVTQLADQIAGLVAGQVTQEEIDDLVAKAEGIAGNVDAAHEPDAGEEVPPPEEPPVEEPPVEPIP